MSAPRPAPRRGRRSALLAPTAACLAAACLAASAAQAQTRGCTRADTAAPPGQAIVCADGLTIRAERDSAFRLLDRDGDGRPDAARLDGRALLVASPPRGGGFQILTPHAIAAVRGTVWAVDVAPGRTSVFVRRGRVAVRRPGGRSVTLGAGDGVDVEARSGPLAVTRWPPERVSALLARFGR